MKVSLPNLADALNRQADKTTLYLNRETGEIVIIADEAAMLAADKVEWEDLPTEQKAAVRDALAVTGSRRGTFVELPGAAERNERGLMREFIDDLDVNNPVAAEDLTGAMRSKASLGANGAQRFRETAARYGLGDAWNAFRADALRQLLLAWCDENGLEVEDALPRASSINPAC